MRQINLFHYWPLAITIILYFMFFGYLVFFQHLPNGLNHDAAWNGLYATRLLMGEKFTFYVPEEYGKETIYHLTLSLIMSVIGINQAAINTTGFFWSIVGIIGMFILLKQLSKKPMVVLVGLLFYSLSSTLFIYAVSGWRLITLIALSPFALAAMVGFQNKPNRLNAFFMGVTSALLMYTYNAGRAQAISLAFFAIIYLIIKRNKKILFNLLIATFVFFLAFLPMLKEAISDPTIWMGRAQALSSDHHYFNKLITSLKLFSISANGNDFFIKEPALELPVSILWIVGLIVTFFNLKKYWPILVNFIAFLLPVIISTPSYHRAIGVYSSIICFAAIALEKIHRKNASKTQIIAIYSFLIVIMFVSLSQRLLVEKITFQSGLGFYPEATSVGNYIKNNLQKYDKLIILANNWPKDILSFTVIPREPKTILKQNYQSYEYSGQELTSYLISDIKNNKFKDADLEIIVEDNLLENFVIQLNQNECEFDVKQLIKNEYDYNNTTDSLIVAHYGRITCSQ